MISVDFSRKVNQIKALHGVNNSPVSFYEPHKELADAGIPYARLHDSVGEYGGAHYVDIPNLFPDFDADANDPASYDFALTDAYIKQLVASGIEPFFRLGVTIENQYKIKSYHIAPPKDYHKWAQICIGVIRHYTQGWADGFDYKIEYWEIWNEPENPPMWSGTREEFFELYRVSANAIKNEFPHLKVGGYAGCGFYCVTRPGMNDFYQSFLSFFDAFLAYVTAPETRAPLDFFSWHLYTSKPEEIVRHARYVDEKLKAHDLSETESIFNEWNYISPDVPNRWTLMKEAPGAAFVAAAFCLMQQSPIGKAMYYDALPSRVYCGLYYFPSMKVTPTYYSFRAFNELYKLQDEAASEVTCESEIYACAAVGKGQGALLVVNHRNECAKVLLKTHGAPQLDSIRLTDGTHVFEEVTDILDEDGMLSLPPLAVVLLQFGNKTVAGSGADGSSVGKLSFAGLDGQ